MIKLITASALALTMAMSAMGEGEHHTRTTTTTRIQEGHREGVRFHGRMHFGERHDRDDFRFHRFPRHGTWNGFEVYIIDSCDYYLRDGCWYPVDPDCGPVYCE